MARAASAVVGVGHTRYGRLPEFDSYELGLWALKDALADAGLTFADIDGLIVNRIPDYQRFCEIAGISPDYVDLVHFRPPAGLWLLRQMALNASG